MTRQDMYGEDNSSPSTQQKEIPVNINDMFEGVLKETRSLIGNKESWIKGHMATNRYNYRVPTTSRQACRFCLMGAVHRTSVDFIQRNDLKMSYRSMSQDVLSLLHAELTRKKGGTVRVNLMNFNDHAKTIHDDVLELIDRTMCRIRQGALQ